MLTHHSLQFLSNLEQNNNREWFHANRKDYEQTKEEFEDLCQEILTGIAQFQENLLNTTVKSCILRINRDIRFSADKSPYKNIWVLVLVLEGKALEKLIFICIFNPIMNLF